MGFALKDEAGVESECGVRDLTPIKSNRFGFVLRINKMSVCKGGPDYSHSSSRGVNEA